MVSYYSQNYSITINDILNNSDLPWDWCWLSHRNDLTIELIQKCPNKNWEWETIYTKFYEKHQTRFVSNRQKMIVLTKILKNCNKKINGKFISILGNENVLKNIVKKYNL